MKVYGIETCGTYKKAIKWFSEHDIEVEPVNLREHPPTKHDLSMFHKKSGLPIKRFLNTSGKVYRDLDMKNRINEMTLDDVYQVLSEQPMLIKRPLIVDGNYVTTGFDEDEYAKRWL